MAGLIITFVLGLFIMLGASIVLFTKNNKNFIDFTLSFALSVMVVLLFTDLLPESYDLFMETLPGVKGIFALFGSILIGFLILFILDKFIPDHDHDTHTKKEESDNLVHIGLVSSLALIIHNFIEGIAIYFVTMNDLSTGLAASLGVGLHNIPLGIFIASTFYQSTKNRKKTFSMIGIISLSTFVGGLSVFLLGTAIPPLLEAIVLSVTSGILLYIIGMELIPKIYRAKNVRSTVFGFALGFLLFLVTLFF